LCGRWLSKNEDDKQIERELAASDQDGVASAPLSKYTVSIKTGSIRGAGTDANVFIILYGQGTDSGKRILDGPGNLFENGKTDIFGFECVELGELTKIRIGHDGTGFGSDWFLEEVIIKNQSNGNEWKFPCNQWFALKRGDFKIERDLITGEIGGPSVVSYKIIVITGNVRGAGTDADVFISILGDKGKIDREKLSNDKDNFERGRVDNFGIKTIDIGEIQNITIGHNGRGFGSAWFLDKVFVINEKTSQRWVFPCNRWFSKKEDDGKIERTLFPSKGEQTTYCLKVKTGLEKGAGTDANIFAIIHGDKGITQKLELKYSLTNANKFERGCLDIFNLDASDVGTLSKVVIGHDNSGIGASWYLDCVEISNLVTNDSWFFPCAQWFDKSKGDKKIERELFPSEKTSDLKDEYTEDEDDTNIEKKQENSKQNTDSSYQGGTISLNIIAARNLASKDSNGLSDPFCKIFLLNEKGKVKKSEQKTRVISKNLNPEWKENFKFEATKDTTGILIDMYDQDKIGEDFMGRVVIPVSKFGQVKEEWFSLTQRKKKNEEVKGDILINFNAI